MSSLPHPSRSSFPRRPVRRLSILLLAVVSAAACSGSGESTSSTEFLSIGSAPPGGAFFIVGGALAEVLTEHGSGNWEVTSEATKGTLESIRRLDRGELELGLANSSITLPDA